MLASVILMNFFEFVTFQIMQIWNFWKRKHSYSNYIFYVNEHYYGPVPTTHGKFQTLEMHKTLSQMTKLAADLMNSVL